MLQTILSPIQAGLLMLEAWPAHCDCFAFAAAAIEEVQCLPNAMSLSSLRSQVSSYCQAIIFACIVHY